MSTILSLLLGYFIGCCNPASWVSRKKKVNLKQEGTGNLGATNTGLVLGRKAGIFVLTFDVVKSFLSYRLARYLFPHLAVAGMVASIGTVLGHCFPVFLNFQGGKGLAAFAGMVLAYRLWFFLFILVFGTTLMVSLDVGIVAPLFGMVAFPVLVYLDCGQWDLTIVALTASILLLYTHWDNVKLALSNQDVVRPREYFRKVFGK